MEERIDAAESRLYARLADVEDRIEAGRQDVADSLGEIRTDLRELAKGEAVPSA